MVADTIPARLLEQVRRRPNAQAYYEREAGVWKATSWAEHGQQVSRAARALLAMDFAVGETVAILGFNRSEWLTMDLAAMAVGGAPAGVYTTCSPEEVQYIVHHAASRVLLIENEAQWAKVNEIRDQLPKLERVVLMRGAHVEDPLVMGWDEWLETGDGIDEARYRERIEALDPNALATLIYTSGTTGPPKGVMLSHENLAWTAARAVELVGLTPEDCLISYLPLSHIAEQMFSVHGPTTGGSAIYFAESIDKLPENLKEVQPTVFFGVPRIWEKFHAGLAGKLSQATGAKAKLVSWAQGVGTKALERRQAGQSPGGIQYAMADKLIFSKVKQAIGLGRVRVCVSGAAPIAREVLEFLGSLDIVVLEVYGQSEDTGPTSFNRPHRFRVGTVGPAYPGVEIKIADDDEILVKGPNVFLGYYKDEDATNETLEGEWLHSGDLGAFDGDFLKIIGRKKEIIITAGGKNIAPKNLEAELKNHELINEAVVIGDRRKYLSALLTLDPDKAAGFADANGLSMENLPESDELQKELEKHLAVVNEKFARVEQIKKVKVLPRNFTVEDGELTPTLKVKRRIVQLHFSDQIESMYQ